MEVAAKAEVMVEEERAAEAGRVGAGGSEGVAEAGKAHRAILPSQSRCCFQNPE
jgi:hypothetical protein